jgi:hypothetical protein
VADPLSADPGPHVFGEASKFLLHLKKQPGVVNRRFDLRSVSDDARIRQQPGDIARREPRDLARVEARECLPKVFALVKHRPPGEPGLERL